MQMALTTTHPQVGWKFGEYQIDGILGEGGVATVCSVRNGSDERMALKVLKREAAQQAEVRACFEREYRIASRLSHTGVVHAMACGEIEGHTYVFPSYER